MKEKAELRKIMKMKIQNQKESERRKRSRRIQKIIFSLRDFIKSRCVMLYVSKGTKEVETGALIKKALLMGKKVVLPVTLAKRKTLKAVYLNDSKESLIKSTYGIYEPRISRDNTPVRLRDIDLAIVPGLAFDKNNNRLGHGQGYYDKFLKRLPKKTPKIGLGFRFQLLEKIPATSKDFSLTMVITD